MTSLIKISNHFKSSARVNETAFDEMDFLDCFVAHGTVLQTISNIGAELMGTRQRAFTVTGPYGTGKSTLALYLGCLLSPVTEVRKKALIKLGNAEAKKAFKRSFPHKDGWVIVKHLCGLSSPVHDITVSVVSSVAPELMPKGPLDEAACLKALKAALDRITVSADGMFIVIDEMGKALDYQASIGGDLHFFQAFADLVQQYDNIIVVGFLHQSFSAYAKGRDTRAQNEWGKVQGRYKDFGFNPTIEESLYLVGESFSVERNLRQRLADDASKVIAVVCENFNIGNVDALINVLPIDPIAALLLGPISKRSFSQNERSLFSFIATHEKNGFRDYAARQVELSSPFEDRYTADHLWAYLDHNLGHIISASADSKAWLEACDAVERAESCGNAIHRTITKIVALLSMMGRGTGLYASKRFLIEYVSCASNSKYSAEAVEDAIEFLESRSIIIYRHNLNSFHIFRASDLDINRLILDWIERVKGGLDWVSVLQTEKLILANAHYHRTGVMRWAETQVVSNAAQVRRLSGKMGEAFANFILPSTPKLYSELSKELSTSRDIVIGKSKGLEDLERASIELVALQKLAKEEADKLSRDPIAKTEIDARSAQAKYQIEKVLNAVLDESSWVHCGRSLKGLSLTAKASEVAAQIYTQCPPVHNELVNRTKLSGTSNSALYKLMQAILLNDRQPMLGLPEATFPPEKGIYLSCFRTAGWHTPNLERSFCGDWFNVKSASEIPKAQRLAYKLWKAGVDFIKASSELVTIQALYDFWMQPPYGLTLGLSKLYATALLKSLDNHLAFYDFDSTKDWIYIPELDDELIIKLWRYPSEAAVRYYELADTDMSLVREIASAADSQNDDSILATARSLVKNMHAIPGWVKRTSGHNLFKTGGRDHLEPVAKRFRDCVLSAKDPYKLILEDIPTLFSSEASLAESLNHYLASLFQMDELLRSEFKGTLLKMLSAELDESLSHRCELVIQNASRPEIENFAKRVRSWSKEKNSQSLDELVALVIGVRKESWTDEKISEGYDKLRMLCVQFRRYETFGAVEQRAAGMTMPLSLIYRDNSGRLVEMEQFVNAQNQLSKNSLKMKEHVESKLSGIVGDERIRVLMLLLSAEMLPMGEEK